MSVEKLDFSSEPSLEQQEDIPGPDLIVDFIRHGETNYGKELEEKLEEAGTSPKELELESKFDDSIEDKRKQVGGSITERGEEQLRKSARQLAENINKNNEIIAIGFGSRTRHKQSANIIADELESQGVEVVKTREHENLADVEGGGWYRWIEYILKHQDKEEVDITQFWQEMQEDENLRKEMQEKGYEDALSIGERTKEAVEILRRFVRRYDLGKTLRVVAVTSDVNLERIQNEHTPEDAPTEWADNAEVLELDVWNDQEGAVANKELSQPFNQ